MGVNSGHVHCSTQEGSSRKLTKQPQKLQPLSQDNYSSALSPGTQEEEDKNKLTKTKQCNAPVEIFRECACVCISGVLLLVTRDGYCLMGHQATARDKNTLRTLSVSSSGTTTLLLHLHNLPLKIGVKSLQPVRRHVHSPGWIMSVEEPCWTQ